MPGDTGSTKSGVVNIYVGKVLPKDKRLKLAQDEQQELERLEQRWFASQSEMETERFRHLTKLEVYKRK